MKPRYFTILLLYLALVMLTSVSVALADNIKLNDGTRIDGTIQKIEAGKVLMIVKGETTAYELRVIDSINFDTPRLTNDSAKAKDRETAEAELILKNLRELDKAEAEIRRMLTQIKGYWLANEPIDPADEPAWRAAKEVFRGPLVRYQELLNDLYFIVLARIDTYNALARNASKVHVGIKGIRVGSSLVSSDLEQLPLKKYVPGAWYNTIFNEGYDLGFSEGSQRNTPNR